MIISSSIYFIMTRKVSSKRERTVIWYISFCFHLVCNFQYISYMYRNQHVYIQWDIRQTIPCLVHAGALGSDTKRAGGHQARLLNDFMQVALCLAKFGKEPRIKKIYGGFHGHGGIPRAGWFLWEHPKIKWMFQEYSYVRKPPYFDNV